MKISFFFSLIFLFVTACNQQFNTPIEPEKVVIKEYLSEADQRYYVVSLVPSEELIQLKKQFSVFNIARGKEQRASNIYLGGNNNQPVIIIRHFDNLTVASKYAALFNEEIGIANQFLPISQQNYRTLLKNKDFTSYRNYYEKLN